MDGAALDTFGADKPTVLKSGASKHAIGTLLEQEGVP